MAKFHRLAAPSYFTGGGTFPSEGGTAYDYINNAASGTPANADDAKIGGVNDGSYFIAFSEDATSNNANRPVKALAQNCDHIDDILHRSLAAAVRTNTVTSTGEAFIVVGTNTFLGVGTVANTATGLAPYFELTDQNDIGVIDADGTPIVINTVTLTTPDALGSNNFSANTVKLNFSQVIPTGQQYRVYYAQRSNLATLPVDAFTFIKVRGAQEVDAQVEGLLQNLHGNSLHWNDPWTSTIWDLTFSGINERYRRSSTSADAQPETYFFPSGAGVTQDWPGAGAFFIRDGAALTGYSQGSFQPTSGPADPLNAIFAAKFRDEEDGGAYGGTTGFAVYGARQSAQSNITAGEGPFLPGLAMYLGLWPHDFTSDLDTSAPYTRVEAWTSATLTTFDSDPSSGVSVVTLTAPNNYFRDGDANSAVSVGYDFLEIQCTLSGETIRRMLPIVKQGNPDDDTDPLSVQVRNLGGDTSDWTGVTAVTVRWVSTSFGVGDGGPSQFAAEAGYTEKYQMDGLFYQVPQNLSADGLFNNVPRTPVRFSAAGVTNSDKALQIGGYDLTRSLPTFPFTVFGDGSLTTQGNVLVVGAGKSVTAPAVTAATNDITATLGNIVATAGNVVATVGNIVATAGDVVANGTTNITGAVRANYLLIKSQNFGVQNVDTVLAFDCAVGSSYRASVTTSSNVTLVISFSHVRTDGQYKFYLDHHTATGTITLAWTGGALTFSPGDDQPVAGAGKELWTGTEFGGEIVWTVTRY